ncbi:hypothetical protein NE237_032103 [Protea cynaroides]|uniref:Protein phosphatase n=1 Tax=Protea cynaroides TaxID=273540 RepID=A0A9Q0L2V9_9MAGN|nr:hypothetical protein NE237_032103 [Protea cynaroides]
MLETVRPAKLPRLSSFHSVVDVTSIPSHNRDENDTLASTKKLKLIMGHIYLPKENGSNPKWEDSHFICEKGQVFSIADGANGWAKKGIDAEIYIRELIVRIFNASEDGLKGSVDPLTVIKEAYSNTKELGSSTACIVALKDYNIKILSNGPYKSQPQQHGLNCPFQLGNNEFKVKVMDGDVIVGGTDGLRVGMYPYWVARMIVEDARIISNDKYIPSLFSLASN